MDPDDPGALPDDPGRSNYSGFSLGDEFLGGNWMILGSKLMRFRGGKVGNPGEMLDPLETKQIYGSNPTKLHQTNKSQKNWGLFLVGIFKF